MFYSTSNLSFRVVYDIGLTNCIKKVNQTITHNLLYITLFKLLVLNLTSSCVELFNSLSMCKDLSMEMCVMGGLTNGQRKFALSALD